VTKFELKFDNVRALNKLGTFSTDSKFDECFKHFVIECEFVENSSFYDWFHMHREPESTDKPIFFLKFNL